MIQLIGFMISAYIITRMVEIIAKKDTDTATAACAFITIIVVLACLYGLFIQGHEVQQALKPFTQ